MEGHNKKAVEHVNGLSLSGLSIRPGSGLTCDACQHPIEPTHSECQTSGDVGHGQPPLRFHQWCYYAKFASNR